MTTPKQTVDQITDTCRQAIRTRYHGPTDHHGSRVTASCDAGRITVPWDHTMDAVGNHASAAMALHDRLGWNEHNQLAMGSTRDGYVFVQIPLRGAQDADR